MKLLKHHRVFWLLWGDSNIGSSRIQGHNIHSALLKKGIYSKILHQSNRPTTFRQNLSIFVRLKKGDLLILQKHKNLVFRWLLFFLKIKGINIALVDCDLPKCDNKLLKYFDFIICASNKLSQLYKKENLVKHITFIQDAIEYLDEKPTKFEKRAIYFGWLNESRMQSVNSLKELLKTNGWRLDVMSNNSMADIYWTKWSDKSTFQIIKNYSASIIPVDANESSAYKSANRILQSLALGNIVLCSNIESYSEIIKNSFNGYLCNDSKDWISALNEISEESKRKEIIRNGIETAKDYTIDKIVLQWISFLNIHH